MSESRYWSHSSRERGNWRWWLHRREKGNCVANCEVSWRGHRLTGIWLRNNDEGRLGASLGLYFVYLHFGVSPFWAKYTGYGSGREISLTFHDGTAHWKFWVDPDGWSSDRPKWRDGYFNPVDALLGRKNCSTRTIEQRDVLVPMPEKSYQATAQLVEYTWKRPRSPFTKQFTRVQIDIPGGIPYEGKGENSWDCGTDATFGMTTGPCKSIAEGVGQLVGSCLHSRVRYGGWDDWNWTKEGA